MAASDNVSKDQFHVDLFHGTTARHAESIKERGLGADIPMVYLTHDRELANYYAQNHPSSYGKSTPRDQSDPNNHPVVFKVRADTRNLRTDWNSFDVPQGDPRKYNRERTDTGELYNRARNKGVDPSEDWETSLDLSGGVVHRGAIPKENLIEISRMSQGEWKHPFNFKQFEEQVARKPKEDDVEW